jgi:hypothetical protein
MSVKSLGILSALADLCNLKTICLRTCIAAARSRSPCLSTLDPILATNFLRERLISYVLMFTTGARAVSVEIAAAWMERSCRVLVFWARKSVRPVRLAGAVAVFEAQQQLV